VFLFSWEFPFFGLVSLILGPAHDQNHVGFAAGIARGNAKYEKIPIAAHSQ